LAGQQGEQHLAGSRPVELHQQHGLPAAEAEPALHHRQAELIAQHQGNQVGMGIAWFIRWDTHSQIQIVVKPGAIRGCQLEEEALDVAQQALLVLVEGESRGGVLAHGHQQAVADPAAINQGLQLWGDVVAAEGAGGLQMEAVMQELGHQRRRREPAVGCKAVSILGVQPQAKAGCRALVQLMSP
jgi:hypothetical protein